MTSPLPLDLYFAFHLHQPVGNFGEVISDHVTHVYRPLLEHLARYPSFPIVVHVSGSLLEWCEKYDHSLIDDLAALASEGRIEFLLAGFYEPVLASIPTNDRHRQIGWLREWLLANTGVTGHGLWLTERVWEPDLTRDLADSGIRYALVDDRHFLVSGHDRESLDAVFRTEHDGRFIDLLPIDEQLRYLIPFRPVDEIVAHFRKMRADGKRFAVFADDAEKFGGWPGTRAWVYDSGWLDSFLQAMADLANAGEVRLLNGTQALSDAARGGMTYLGSASYHEMEEWSLSPQAAVRYEKLIDDIGAARMAGPDSALIRGAHWKHFLVKYPEANRIHKHMLALSALCESNGNPEEPRRAIGRAQSNDPLWHGVFGGLYLPWLREEAWRNLAAAEAGLRKGEALGITMHDHDGDGESELWVHSDRVSITIAPHRGGAVEQWLLLEHGLNGADALTRRIEAYHYAAVRLHRSNGGAAAGVDAPVPAAATASTAGADGAPNRTGGTNGSHTSGRIGSAARDGVNSRAGGESDSASGSGVNSRAEPGNGAESIHEQERRNALPHLPPQDPETRSLFQVRIVDGSLTKEQWESGRYIPIRCYSGSHLEASVTSHTRDEAIISLRGHDYSCTVTVSAGGRLSFDIVWSRLGFPIDAQCAVELSLAPRFAFSTKCDCGRLEWQMPITSVARSERGLEHTVQGQAVLFLIPIAKEKARITVNAAQSAE